MSPKLERVGLGLILGPVLPIGGLLSGWWSAYAFLPEAWIACAALSGLFLGLLADLIFLKRWISQARHFNYKFWILLYSLYSLSIFGFFMGVPVFNLFLAVPTGFVVAAKLAIQPSAQPSARQTAQFTTGGLFLICLASTLLALTDPFTGANLKGMLGLAFEPSPGQLLALVLLGGAALLAGNWWLTLTSLRFSSKILQKPVA